MASTTATGSSSAGIDPRNQTFNLYDSNGDEFTVNISDVTRFVHDGVVQSIVLASQIGAAAAILLVLLILTKSDKRRLPVFILNTLALILTFIDQILYCLYYTGPWYNPYAYLSGDYTFVPQSSKGISAAAEVLAFFVELCLEASLVLQVYVVCVTLQRSRKAMVILVSTLVAIVSVGFRLAQVVLNIKINIVEETLNPSVAWVAKARDITLTISICFFSSIFCLKLGWAMYQRRLLGLNQFGPMQVIFIGGTQTLIIPVICAIFQFVKPTVRASSLILTVTAISLPLTSLWASASINRPNKAARGPDAHHKFIMSTSAGSKLSKQPLGNDSYFADTDSHTPVRDRYDDSNGVEKDWGMQELGRAE